MLCNVRLVNVKFQPSPGISLRESHLLIAHAQRLSLDGSYKENS